MFTLTANLLQLRRCQNELSAERMEAEYKVIFDEIVAKFHSDERVQNCQDEEVIG